jgi:para-nitrobenzyl esterase
MSARRTAVLTHDERTMKRRDFIGYGALAGAGLVLDGELSRAWAQSARAPGATVQTSAGRVRGYVDGGVQVFTGVPYGATTAGAGRFMPPQAPRPWTGVRDAFDWGQRAPGFVGGEPDEMLPTDPREAQGEDCLVLNLWTPATSGRRPVMVWLHGGGYRSGSGSYSIYSGRELARKHDVVSIALNHRLNIFGFLYLAEYGGRWAQASNAGILDVVRALEWVRENIAGFGGDPDNVTIFGQSGGAGKVSTVMALPAAKGLFHRAIAQSGSNLTGIGKADAIKTTELVLQRLDVKPDQLERLQSMPIERVLAVTRQAGDPPNGLNFGPVVDGRSLPAAPFDPAAPGASATVPFLTGTTATESTFFAPDERLRPIDAAEFRSRVKALLTVDDAKAGALVALYKKEHPSRTDIDLWNRLESDASAFRSGVDTQAERKASQGAPVFLYRFEYYSPVRDGRLMSMHCMEIPFVFDNLAAGKVYTGDGPAAQRVADQMSAAWVAFARTGNPGHKGIPAWTAFNAAARTTLVFGPETKLVNDPGSAERLAIKALRG